MGKIDFVVTWVDGSDPAWRKDFQECLPAGQPTDDIREIRYRDWENLRYWFRGVEKFAPWVNRIHFVTNGQKPDWLDLDAPRLNFVKHSDFMPPEVLPTFNSRAIIMNLHRIKGLADDFVCFDDDCFLIDSVAPERFFRKGMPCDMAAFNALCPERPYAHNLVVNMCIINSSFASPRSVVFRNFRKWLTFRSGSALLRTLFLLPWPRFSCFYNHHLPQGYRKATFEEIWSNHPEILRRTTASRFRSISDVTPWVLRYWHLVKGDFTPLNVLRHSAVFHLSDTTLDKAVRTIAGRKRKIVCLNEGPVTSFEDAKTRINAAFQKILPEKSSFEKW